MGERTHEFGKPRRGGHLWQAGGATVTGEAHRRLHLPNQDALLALPETGFSSQIMLAVSDGHGWAASYRSDVGAQLAVAAARDVFSWFLRANRTAHLPETGPEALPEAIVKDWRLKVQAHVNSAPLPLDCAGDVYTVYGATLAAVVATHTQLIAVQIGDGDICLGYADHSFERPLPDNQGLRGEETYSLCMPNAAVHARMIARTKQTDAAWPDFVFLSTDGVTKARRAPGAFETLCVQTRESARKGFQTTRAKAPAWLKSTPTSDDATMCFAMRT